MHRSFLAGQNPSELEFKEEPNPIPIHQDLSSSGKENEGCSSNSPVPEQEHNYAPCKRMKFTVRLHISPVKKEEEMETPVTVTKPVFLCKHCLKEYTSLGALKNHRSSHTLPCVCTTCGRVFSRPGQLRGHICKKKSLQVAKPVPPDSGSEVWQQDVHDNEPDALTT